MKFLPDFIFPRIFTDPVEVLAEGEEALEASLEEAEKLKEEILDFLKKLREEVERYKIPFKVFFGAEAKGCSLRVGDEIELGFPMRIRITTNRPEVLSALAEYCEWLITEGGPEALKEMRRLKRVPVEEIKKDPERVKDYLRPLWLLNAVDFTAMSCGRPRTEAAVESSHISIFAWLPWAGKKMFYRDLFDLVKEGLPEDKEVAWGYIAPEFFSVNRPGTVPQKVIVSAFKSRLGDPLRKTLEERTLKFYELSPWPLIHRVGGEAACTVGIGYRRTEDGEAFRSIHFWTKEPPELLCPATAFREALRELRSV